MDINQATEVAKRRAPGIKVRSGQISAQSPEELREKVNAATRARREKEDSAVAATRARLTATDVEIDEVLETDPRRRPLRSHEQEEAAALLLEKKKTRQAGDIIKFTVEIPRHYERCLTLAAMDAEDAKDYKRGLREPQLNAYIRHRLRQLFEELHAEYPNPKAKK